MRTLVLGVPVHAGCGKAPVLAETEGGNRRPLPHLQLRIPLLPPAAHEMLL